MNLREASGFGLAFSDRNDANVHEALKPVSPSTERRCEFTSGSDMSGR